MHYQRNGADNNTYYKKFLAYVETIETYGGKGSIGIIPTLVTAKIKALAANGRIKDAANPSNTERKLAISQVQDEYLGALMLSGSNRKRFSYLRMDLRNQYGYGNDNYPKSADQCLAPINRWQQHTPSRPKCGEPTAAPAPAASPTPTEEALVFAQESGDAMPPKDDSSSSKGSSISTTKSCRPSAIRCKSCGQLGHASSVCPAQKMPPAQIHAMNTDNTSRASNEDSVIILAQLTEAAPALNDCNAINKDVLLLDSQSTVDLFSNPAHVA